MDDDTRNIIEKISESVEKIDSRLRAIEEKDSVASTQETPPAEAPGVVADEISEEVFDLNTSFNAIKSAVQHMKLPSSLIVPTDKTGVKKADQPLLNLITKVAKYAETGLKVN